MPTPPPSSSESFRERMLALVDEHERLQHAFSHMFCSERAELVRRSAYDGLNTSSDGESLNHQSTEFTLTSEASVPQKTGTSAESEASLCTMSRWKTSDASVQMMREASLRGHVPEIIRVLDQRGDPNCIFSKFHIGGKEISTGGPLAIACLRADADAMVALLDRHASPDSQYTCVVGALQNEVTFTVAHAIVGRGSVEMLQTLMGFKADIHAKTSLGGNLLWEASFTGRSDIAHLLIDNGLSLEESARSQDDTTQVYTPLHASSLQGHTSLVDILLKYKADVDGKNLNKTYIVEDAISAGHAGVVRKLVANGASLSALQRWIKTSGSRKSVSSRISRRQSTERSRVIDHLFRWGNDVVIASAALGMKRAMAEELDKLTIDDFVNFMCTPGDAPEFFLEAIMRPYRISYWGAKSKRVHVSAGMVPINEERNVGVGPHVKELSESFQHKQILDDNTQRFIHALIDPSTVASNFQFRCCANTSRFVPGIFTMCHLAGMGDDPRVIHALAKCSLKIFRQPDTQVIVEAQWRKVKITAGLVPLWSVLYMLVFMVINYVLISDSGRASSSVIHVTLVGMGVWLFEFVFRLVLVMGTFTDGSDTISESLLLIEVAMSGGCLAFVLISNGAVKEYTFFNTAIGVTVLFRWTKVLWELTAMRSIGLRVLPILIALQHMGAFCGVLLVFLLASTNMYFALNYQPAVDECFMIIFRIVFLGDMNIDEVMNVRKIGSIKDGGLYEDLRTRDFEYAVVRSFVCCVVFFMSTAMMNIFIAVLSRCFEDAMDNKLSLFLHRRAQVIQKHLIMKSRFSALAPEVFRRKHRKETRDGEREEATDTMQYLWCFTPTEHEEDENIEPAIDSKKISLSLEKFTKQIQSIEMQSRNQDAQLGAATRTIDTARTGFGSERKIRLVNL